MIVTVFKDKVVQITFILLFIVVSGGFSQQQAKYRFSRIPDGIVLTLQKQEPGFAGLIRLKAINDKVIRVTASPCDPVFETESLMTVPLSGSASFTVTEGSDEIVFSTAKVKARISTLTGQVRFFDTGDQPILQEAEYNNRCIKPFSANGELTYSLQQAFDLTPDEGLYGLGQHQNGIMNYRGSQVLLAQYNTEVAIPFLVSSKNYGILWDNYSVTTVGDDRDYNELNDLRLFSKTGDAGWLTATYRNKTDHSVVTARPESKIDYDYLASMKNFPEGVKPDKSSVTWEGSFSSPFNGRHTFLFRSAGYGKIWIDGKLLADRWRQCWNAETVLLPLDLEKGRKYSLKIEWDPDGAESFLSCRWMAPPTDFGKNRLSFRSEAGDHIDYYFVYGVNMDDVISGYRAITGKAAMLPLWSFGFWQSRERYKTQDEILQTVEEFRARKIPLDNIVLDWSYWEENKWGSHDFDLTRFPDIGGLIKTLHEKYNTRFMISVWPKFYEGTSNYDFLNKNGWLYKRNIADSIRDWIGKGYRSTFYDAYNPEARGAFWGLMNKKLYAKGIDAWWLDASEPDLHSNLSIEDRKLIMTPTALGTSTKYFNGFPLMNAKAVYEGQRGINPDTRVFILTRSAYAGMQKYGAVTWSGDISSRWHDMKNQISAGVNFSMSGMPYWTMDIGGFALERRYENAKGKDLDEWREIQTRWYQFGAFCPLFRVHGQFPYREIYNIAPQDHPAYKSMLYYNKLRYRLLPYIYSLAGMTTQNDYTIMRGLVMDFASDANVKNINDQFMFGPSILVNPVCEYGAVARKVYLPAGQGWFDFYTGSYYTGNQKVLANAPYENIPLFIKEGSILPTGPDLQFTAEKQADPITLFVYTGKDAAFTIYEDENTSYNYEKGAFALIPIIYNEKSKTVTIGERKGTFPGMLNKRTFKIIWISKSKNSGVDFHKKADKTLVYNGEMIVVKQ